jgi:hypothetical protein
MRDNRPKTDGAQHLWEVLLSLHFAFLGVSVAPFPALIPPLARMEGRINGLLHIRQTDFVRGYFVMWVPSAALALVIWLLLRALRRTRLAQESLRSVAGIATLLAPPVYWVYHYDTTSWPVGWPYQGAPFEIAMALLCAILFAAGRWKAPLWAGVLLLVLHYGFWWFVPGSEYEAPNYSGPLGPALGFCAALAWIVYLSRLRKARELQAP